MAVSSEFEKTVQENHILRIRIMLKDSLLVDKSFSKYKELLTYAETQGVEVWMTQEDPIEHAKKPWTLDLMNYELTALVNDFTREHVQYVQQIIKEVYKGEGSQESSQILQVGTGKQPTSSPPSSDVKKAGSNTNDSSYKTIEEESKNIERIVRASKKKVWREDDIEKIKESARRIVIACENKLGRK